MYHGHSSASMCADGLAWQRYRGATRCGREERLACTARQRQLPARQRAGMPSLAGLAAAGPARARGSTALGTRLRPARNWHSGRPQRQTMSWQASASATRCLGDVVVGWLGASSRCPSLIRISGSTPTAGTPVSPTLGRCAAPIPSSTLATSFSTIVRPVLSPSSKTSSPATPRPARSPKGTGTRYGAQRSCPACASYRSGSVRGATTLRTAGQPADHPVASSARCRGLADEAGLTVP